jgi:hypothetical protein
MVEASGRLTGPRMAATLRESGEGPREDLP